MGRLRWAFNVWLARRFLRNMTVDKVAVLAHVTGVPASDIATLHPCFNALESVGRVNA